MNLWGCFLESEHAPSSLSIQMKPKITTSWKIFVITIVLVFYLLLFCLFVFVWGRWSIHLEFNTVCYYSNFIALLAWTKGLHLVHFMLLCQPTPSQCFILSVFKGICGSHSCWSFVTESSLHCVKCWVLRGLPCWWHYWISKQKLTTFKCWAHIHIFLYTIYFSRNTM